MNTSNTHRLTGVVARLLVAGLTACLVAVALFSFSTGTSHASILRSRPTPSPTPSSGTWTMTGSMNQDRDTFTATLLQNGQVLAAGGDEDQYPLASDTAELYNPSKGTWTYTNGLMRVARTEHTATLLPNGQVLVVGGMDPFENMQATAELYNPSTGYWTLTGSMATARSGHTATLLPNGEVLVAGGCTGVVNYACNYTASAELYNPSTGTWTTTGSMHVARYRHTATLLPNGEVLVAGGCTVIVNNVCNFTASAELYNPATGTWTYTGSMSVARSDHTATLLPNEEVLVAAGCIITPTDGCYAVASAELYNPSTGVWATTGSLNHERYNYTATLLSNGKVLVAGGEDNVNYAASAELYNPATGAWTYTGSLHNPRSLHAAALLSNSKVLVAGGILCTYNSVGCNLAELYTP